MKIQIRKCIFETNSSSVHCLVMCSEDEYKKWEEGEYVLDHYDEKLVPLTEEIKKEIEERDYTDYLTWDGFDEYCEYYYTFQEEYKTKGGENIIAFGYYGHD